MGVAIRKAVLDSWERLLLSVAIDTGVRAPIKNGIFTHSVREVDR
ncbi:hypothetical protein [Sphingobium arseniciresistens]